MIQLSKKEARVIRDNMKAVKRFLRNMDANLKLGRYQDVETDIRYALAFLKPQIKKLNTMIKANKEN